MNDDEFIDCHWRSRWVTSESQKVKLAALSCGSVLMLGEDFVQPVVAYVSRIDTNKSDISGKPLAKPYCTSDGIVFSLEPRIWIMRLFSCAAHH